MNKKKIQPEKIIKGVLFDFDGTLTYPGALDFPAIKREMNCPADQPTSQLIVVGDFRFDVMAGKEAGAYTVFITNKNQTAMAPGDPEPDYTIDYLEELLEIID